MKKSREDISKIFKKAFGDEIKDIENLKYQEIIEWYRVGHMNLMSEIEEELGIELDIDDIIEFSSFEKGIEILSKYNVDIK